MGLDGTTTVPSQLVLHGTFVIDGEVNIYKGVKFVIYRDATLSMSNQTYINEYSRIFCKKAIKLGSHCSISWHVTIMDTDLHSIFNNSLTLNPDREVAIGNNVWIGAYSYISKGVIINDNVIIGYGSICKGIFNSNFIYKYGLNGTSSPFQTWM